MSENGADRFHFEKNKPSFEDLGRQNGFRYWYAREFMQLLGYTDYSVFKRVINKAITVCHTLDIDVALNFEQVSNSAKQPDYRLSKFACYLVLC